MTRYDDEESCDMRGMLGFLILFLLYERMPMHGQEIADELAKRRGDRPSPGTIYPALKGLKDAGYLHEEEKIGKAISYTLTPSGMKAFHVARRRFTKTFLGVLG